MTKHLTTLMCALLLTGFGALASAEPASSTAQPAPAAVQPLFESAAFMSQGACAETLSNSLMPAPVQKNACQGWLYGSCDRRADCTGFYCPLGELKSCVGGTGSGCLGTCDCVP